MKSSPWTVSLKLHINFKTKMLPLGVDIVTSGVLGCRHHLWGWATFEVILLARWSSSSSTDDSVRYLVAVVFKMEAQLLSSTSSSSVLQCFINLLNIFCSTPWSRQHVFFLHQLAQWLLSRSSSLRPVLRLCQPGQFSHLVYHLLHVYDFVHKKDYIGVRGYKVHF